MGIIWVRAAIPCLAERHCILLQLHRSFWLPAHKFAVVLSLLSNLLLWKRSYPSGSEIILQWDEAHSKQQKHKVTLEPLSALTVAFVLTFLDLEILTKSIRSVFLRKHETEFKIHILVKTDTLHLTSGVILLLQSCFLESFDQLPEDCGLFDGGKPTVLESHSGSDWRVLLKERKTAPVEFRPC